MHRVLLTLVLTASGLFPTLAQTTNSAAAAVPQPAVTPPLATAVLNFQTSDETAAKQGAEIAVLLESDLSNSSHALMVERQDMDKILGEQALGLSGLVSADSAAKVGSLTGAQVLITGRYFQVGSQNLIVAKIISTETSRVYGVTSTVADPNNLAQAVEDLSGKVDGVLDAHRAVLIAPQESDDERHQRLRKLLPQGQLPTMTVVIPETDYSHPTVDPAAQTEISKALEELGFKIIDASDTRRKADITITGEAFSEQGARQGNLVSGLGRVEIKVTRNATKDLIWTDRETRVAVDVGDHTAGKAALAKAARILFERLLPKLTK